MEKLLAYDVSSDPIFGMVFIVVFLVVFVILGLIGDKTGNYEAMQEWSKIIPNESTGNRGKRNKRRKKRRELEQKYNLEHESLSYHTEQDLYDLEQRLKNQNGQK